MINHGIKYSYVRLSILEEFFEGNFKNFIFFELRNEILILRIKEGY